MASAYRLSIFLAAQATSLSHPFYRLGSTTSIKYLFLFFYTFILFSSFKFSILVILDMIFHQIILGWSSKHNFYLYSLIISLYYLQNMDFILGFLGFHLVKREKGFSLTPRSISTYFKKKFLFITFRVWEHDS